MRVDDSRLQGIPRYKTNNCKSLSLARCEFKRLAEDPLGQADMLVARISVARVRPRTSKGITDLLLLNLVLLDAASPSKKNLDCTKDNPTI